MRVELLNRKTRCKVNIKSEIREIKVQMIESKSGSTYSKNSTLPQISMKLTSNRLEIKILFRILDLLNIIYLVK